MVKSPLEFLDDLKKRSPLSDDNVNERNDTLGTSRKTVLGNLIQQYQSGEAAEQTFDNMQLRIRELGDKAGLRSEEENEELAQLLKSRDVWEAQRARDEQKEFSAEEASFKARQNLGDPNNSVGGETLSL